MRHVEDLTDDPLNLEAAKHLLAQMGSGADPEFIAAEMDEAVVLEIQGDEGAMPWIGRRTGCRAIAHFFTDQRSLLTSNMFRVDDILASDRRAVVIGALSDRWHRHSLSDA